MLIVDTHCDTLTKIMECHSNLYKNNCHVDIERMLSSKHRHVRFFAAFIDPGYCQAYAMKRALQILDKFYEQQELFSQSIGLCTSFADIGPVLDSGKVAAFLSIEGGDALQGDLPALRMFYRLGVRSICLTWNYRNEIADGVKDAESGGGLTPFGRNVIKEMNRLGMLADLSHISEKGFWDVIETSSAPIMASHSNARNICSHPRNLTDGQLLAVKKNGGVVGVNLYPPFLDNSGEASLSDIIRHIEYMSGITGCDHIGIGADFDGIEAMPAGIRGVEDIDKVFNELLKLNYSQENVEKIAGGNFLRLIGDVIR